ncbi:MAG: cyclase family protein [Desulfarculaceae bacterium]
MSRPLNLVDLSHSISPEMPRFGPQVPPPQITPWMSHEQAKASGNYQGCTCEVSQVSLVTSLGTYLDSPYHFHPGKTSIEGLDIDSLVLPGVKVDCTQAQAGSAIGPEVLEGMDIKGKVVLFHTGWSRYWHSPQYFQFPFLSEATAQALCQGGAKMAGVDFLVIDDTNDPRRPVHVTLLKAGILIVENLTNLDQLPSEGFFFSAAPVKVAKAAAFPVRAYAWWENSKG